MSCRTVPYFSVNSQTEKVGAGLARSWTGPVPAPGACGAIVTRPFSSHKVVDYEGVEFSF